MDKAAEALPETSPHSPEPDPAPVTDANPESSTGTTPDATSESSTENTGAKEPRSFGEALDQAAAKLIREGEEADEETPADLEPEEDSPTDPNAEEGKAKPAEGEGSKDGQPKQTGEAADGAVPFHKHPRWQEKLRVEAELKSRVEQLEPARELVDNLRAWTGDEQGLHNAVEVIRQYAESPAQAVPLLEKLLQDARERGGLVLTDPALRERVDNAELDEETALELQRARTGEVRQQHQQQSLLQQQAQARQREVATSLDQWSENVRSRDPDFGVLTRPDNPEHGLSIADQVFEVFLAKSQMSPGANAQKMVSMAQEAYDIVKKRVGTYQKPASAIRPLTSQSSSTTAKARPKTMREAMDQLVPG